MTFSFESDLKKNTENSIKRAILNCIRDNDGKLYQKSVAEKTELSPTTVSTYVRILNIENFVRIEKEGSNKKLFITRQGEEFLRK